MRQKFRSKIKEILADDFKAKFIQIYMKVKMELLESINDQNLKEHVRLALPSANSLRSAKKLPTAPKKLEDVDFEIINREGLNIDE